MKAIHTSDWHIGQNLYGTDRSEEHLHFLKQLCTIIDEEQPDVLIVSGDIYDSVAPSIASQKLYNKMMLQLHATLPTMKIVVTAGNHDSSSRLELNSTLWSVFDVNIVGNIERKDEYVNYDKHIIDIKDKEGKNRCYVIAVPYIYHANYPVDNENSEARSKMLAFHQKLIDYTKERNTENLPIIMTGHLAVSGTNIKGHEKRCTHLVYENIEELGEGYDYLALGHIHFPQQISGCTNARYSGSPFPMSFDEEYRHSVSIIEIDTHGDTPQIKTRAIEPLIPLCTIPENGGDIDEVLQAIDNLPDTKAYIRVKLKVADVLPMHERKTIEEKFANIKAELFEIYPVREKRQTEQAQTSIAIEEIHQISPLEIAMDYYHKHFGSEMNDELKKMLIESIENVEQQG